MNWTKVAAGIVIRKKYEHVSADVHFYIIHSYEGIIYPRENQEIAWVDPGKVKAADFLKADQEILEKVKYLS